MPDTQRLDTVLADECYRERLRSAPSNKERWNMRSKLMGTPLDLELMEMVIDSDPSADDLWKVIRQVNSFRLQRKALLTFLALPLPSSECGRARAALYQLEVQYKKLEHVVDHDDDELTARRRALQTARLRILQLEIAHPCS